MLRGVDVSHHQGKIDFAKVAASGVRFVYLKATQGKSFVDDMFLKNVKAAQAAGLAVGAYHYFVPDGGAGGQFSNFWAAVMNCGGPAGMLVPALDVEGDNQNTLPSGFTGEQYVKSASAWLSYLWERTGRKGIVYTYPSFNNTYLKGGLGEYPLWAAAYPTLTLTSGKLTKWQGWTDWLFWQYAVGSCPGVSGACDLDCLNGDEEALKRLIV